MRIKNHTQAMTLRLEPELHEYLIEAAYESRTSKSSYIRAAIRQRMGITDGPPQKQRANHQR
jgi:predicted HicB family RNase H-like nuclease